MLLILRVLAILAVIAVGVFFAERPGAVTLTWQGWRIDTSVGALLVAILLVFVVLTLLWWLARLMIGLPARIGRQRRETRRRAAFAALTESLIALAAGDPVQARARAEAARLICDVTPLPLLVAAEAASRAGDRADAELIFNELRARPDAAFLGQRGLALQALSAGEDERALEFLTEAQQQQPQVGWIAALLPVLQARRGQWRLAREAVGQAVKDGTLSPETGRRQRLALLTGGAIEASRDGEHARALELTREAVKLDPGFTPAAIERARLLREDGSPEKARKLLEQAWMAEPHPQLALSYGSLGPQTPLARADAIDRLARQTPGNQVAQLAAAAADLDAGLWGPARKWLDAAERSGPVTARLCRLRALLAERGDHDEAASRAWSERAAASQPDPFYTCEQCGAETELWSALCPRCRQLATLRWGRSPHPSQRPVGHSSTAGWETAAIGFDLRAGAQAAASPSGPEPLLTPLPPPEYGRDHPRGPAPT